MEDKTIIGLVAIPCLVLALILRGDGAVMLLLGMICGSLFGFIYKQAAEKPESA